MEIGNILADAMERVGKDGVITVEEGKSLATEVKRVEGMEVRQGLPVAALRHQPGRWSPWCHENPGS